MKFYVAIASALAARNNCEDRQMFDVAHEWRDYIDYVVARHAPRGSGFDNGTTLNADCTRIGGRAPQRLVFDTAFHHMHESGVYDGWTHHQVWVYPWFDGLDIRITGRDRADIKDYIAEIFHTLASEEVLTFGEWREQRRKNHG